MVLVGKSILTMTVTGLLGLAGAAAIAPATCHGIQERKTLFANMIADSPAEHLNRRQGAVHRCYPPSPATDPTPSIEDCKGAIAKLQTVQSDIEVKLVEGCYETWNGNCTASVCPQKDGASTISPSTAAQFMIDSVMTDCISNGLRGWYLDRSYGIGVYLT